MIKDAKIIFCATAFFLFLEASWCFADGQLDFQIPAPPDAKLVDKRPLTLVGRDMLTESYQSGDSIASVAEFYKKFFRENRFSQAMDKAMSNTTNRQMRFKKGDLAVDVVLSTMQDKTGIAVAKYLQPAGMPDLEKSKLSMKDTFLTMPKEDLAGEDLRIIPRPPESVRLQSRATKGSQMLLAYTSELSVEELGDFYKTNMAYQGWEMKKEVYAGDVMKAYKQKTGKEALSQGGSIFSDGKDLNSIISQGHILNFEGRFGKATISIFPNIMGDNSGSLVRIIYREAE